MSILKITQMRMTREFLQKATSVVTQSFMKSIKSCVSSLSRFFARIGFRMTLVSNVTLNVLKGLKCCVSLTEQLRIPNAEKC
ncbi:MAG: hypothetical protein N2748_06280, partial [candidate division WOR-3 bacterium]|nr:hypothetical protein [candidate division WOR-3 bacterium]